MLYILVALIIAVIAASIAINKRLKERIHFVPWFFLTLMAIIGVSQIFAGTINNLTLRSRVDASPLAQLTEGQVARVDEIWERLARHDNIRQYSGWVLYPHSSELHSQHSFYWHSGDDRELPDVLAYVRVYVHMDENDAIRWIQPAPWGGRRGTAISNDNGTGAFLWRVSLGETSFNIQDFILPDGLRHFSTNVRIGNTVFSINEWQPWHGLGRNYTDQLILTLMEILQEYPR